MARSNSQIFILVFLGMLTAFGPFVIDNVFAHVAGYDRFFSHEFFTSTVGIDSQYDRVGGRATFVRSAQ